MHHDTEYLVEAAKLALVRSSFLIQSKHRVNHTVECDKKTPLGEKKDHEETADMSIIKFVNYEVCNDSGLSHKKCFLFAPAWDDLIVSFDSNDHVDSHQSRLKDDPTLLDPV